MSIGLNIDFILSPVICVTLLSFIIYFFWTPFLRLITPQGVAGIPCLPSPSPLIGDLPWIAAKLKENPSVRLMDELAKELGPICQIRITFLRTMVIVMDYQEMESILGSRSSEFDRDASTTALFRPLLPTGQIAQKTGNMWKHHRRIIGPAMTSKYLSLTTPRANESVRELIELFKAKAEIAGDRSLASEGDMSNSAMDAVCGMAFGASWGINKVACEQVRAMISAPSGVIGEAVFKTTQPEIAEATWYLFEALPITSLLPSVSHFFTSLSLTYRRHKRDVRGLLQARLEESRKKTKLIGAEAAVELADNTLDMMVAREHKAEDWMPDNEMIDEILQYLVAGTETSGVALTWWLKFMTNNPSIQRKLRDHILSRMPELQDRQPTFEDLNATNLPYLEAVIHETLRLSRTAGAVIREPKQDCVILGHRIPKGTTIFLSTAIGTEDASTPTAAPYSSSTVSHGDKSSTSPDKLVQQSDALASLRTESANKRKVGYWAAGTGHVFDPERWLDERGELDLSVGPSLPFSQGQRGCFGKNLAMLELRLFISQLNLAFFFGKIEDDQNSMDIHETVATHPVQSFIRPLSWDSEEARAYYLAK